MSRILIKILIFFLLPEVLLAQLPSYDLEWSTNYRYRDVFTSKVVDLDSNFFYTLGFKSGLLITNKWYLAKYNRKKSKQIWQLEVERIIYQGIPTDLLSAHIVNGHFYLFLEAYNPRDDKKHLLLQVFDKNGDSKELKLVESVDSKRRNHGNFRIQFSEDRTNFLIFSSPAFGVRQPERFAISVYGVDLQLKWSKDIQLDVLDRYMNINKIDLSNSGEVYLIAKKTIPKRSLSDKWNWGMPNSEYIIYKVVGQTDELKKINLGLNNVFVTNMGLELDFSDNLVAIGGFYSERGYRNSSIKGMFYVTLDQTTNKNYSKEIVPFRSEFIDGFRMLGRSRGGREIREDFVFRHFLHRSDGGAYIIAEDYEMEVRTQQTRNGTITNYYYYYNDIIAFGVSPLGEIEWSGHIPKRQYSKNDGGHASGYLPLVDGKQLHILFNDHPSNMKRFGDRRPISVRNFRRSNFVAVSINEDSEMHYNVLYSNAKEAVMTLPKRSSSNESLQKDAVLFSARNSKIQFGSFLHHK
jgi:hypothetical protein|tara:strand:- start:2516 stop:4081 length:1566 start_codon:yes stop_codon:yes gene_type:complete